MPTYSISQVETLTGILAHTLRIWEKRYGFIVPERTDTKIRFYTDDQLKLLLNVSILSDAGYKISKLAAMSREQILDASLEIQGTSASDHSDFNALIICMLDFDEARFEELFQHSIIRRGLVQTIVTLMYPLLQHIGVLWGVDRVLIAHEHFISNLIRKKLFASIDSVPSAKNTPKKALLFLPAGEEHEIGLLLAYFIFKQAGYQVYYLGSNVPLENVSLLEEQIKPSILFTIIINPASNKTSYFEHLLSHFNTELLISGNPSFHFLQSSKSGKFRYIAKPIDLLTFIRN